LILLFILIFLEMPIGLAMGLMGFLGIFYILNFAKGMSVIAISPFSTMNSYYFAVLPLFLLMGELANYSGITEDAYRTVNKWIGHLPGGLALVSIGACAGFAAVCGSSQATCVAMGKVALPEMRRYHYDDALATGAIGAGGTLGILIPPSSGFIFYAMMTEQSVGKLFIAGIIPGIILTLLLMLTVYILVKIKPSLGPAGIRSSWRERFASLSGIWKMLVLFILIMGGIWGGIFTPTEAAGVAAFVAFLFLLMKRQSGMTLKAASAATLRNTVRISGLVFLIMIGAMIFSAFMALTRLPEGMANLLTGFDLPPLGALILVLILYLVLGCFMETTSMILLTVPIVFPTVMALGYDPIWFGVVIVILQEIAFITPPIGPNVFAIAGIAPEIPMYTIFRGVAPFVVTLLIALIIIIAFPELSLFLPNTMK
jgi:tripartite ATP-independent transporter DctM subunit